MLRIVTSRFSIYCATYSLWHLYESSHFSHLISIRFLVQPLGAQQARVLLSDATSRPRAVGRHCLHGSLPWKKKTKGHGNSTGIPIEGKMGGMVRNNQFCSSVFTWGCQESCRWHNVHWLFPKLKYDPQICAGNQEHSRNLICSHRWKEFL